MPRKKKDEEQEVDVEVKAPVKKESFVTKWFNDYAVNDRQDLKMICDLTARSAQEQFCMSAKSNHSEVFGVIFYATFLSILEFIKGKQKSYNDFAIEICNSINLGYVNNDSDDNEKIGNFMPIMEYIGINRTIVDDSSIESDTTSQNFMRWKQLNIKKNVEYYKEIQEKAYAKLKSDFKTDIRNSEGIIPLFCIFTDNITNVLKMKFNEASGTNISEVHMNVFGLFDVYYSFDEEEDKENIEFSPSISMKLALKCDEIAMRDN